MLHHPQSQDCTVGATYKLLPFVGRYGIADGSVMEAGMNIFVLDVCPIKAAQMLGNKHVVKMILETGQMLSTIQRRYGSTADGLYKATHANHPCTVWARESASNYRWLVAHFKALSDEYTFRYGKIHATWTKLKDLVLDIPDGMCDIGLTPFAQAMPDEFRQSDAVQAYRAYYRSNKAAIAVWTKRDKPDWMEI